MVTTVLEVQATIATLNQTSICDGDTYIEGTSDYSITGVYEDVYTSVQGCDSIVTTDLTVFPTAESLVNITLCEGESYFEGNNEYSVAGTYFDFYETINGCDSLVTTVVAVNPIDEITIEVTINEGESHVEGDNEYTSAGSYLDVYQNVYACDSTITTILTVNQNYETITSATICEGEEYMEGSSIYTSTGTYTENYTSVLGTDSIVITNLTVNPSPVLENTITICAGNSYTEGTSTYSLTGTYTDIYSTTLGCDSTVITNLTVLDEILTENDVELCNGGSYQEGSETYTENGIYEVTYISAQGCDSIVVTNVTVLEPLVSPQFVILCAGETFTEGTSIYDVSGTYEDVYTSVSGCDSLIITELLVLDANNTINNVEICAGSQYMEGTSVYTDPGTYEDIYLDINGCDSVVVTNLSVLPPISVTNEVEICTGSVYIEGTSIYDSTGTYTDTYQTTDGCDSLVITVLAVNDFVTNTINASICEGETYTEGNSSYTITGIYNDLYTTATGCDSLVVTNLTVNAVQYTNTSVTICEGEIYTEGTSIYNTTGVYTDIYQSITGCDSTVTTNLTVIPAISILNNISICEGETYAEGSSIYSESGTYIDIYTSFSGCDSTVTTVLTVNPLLATTNAVNICLGETYTEGSSIYNTTGIYTDVYTSSLGCDSTVTTLLTVNEPTVTQLSLAVCENTPLPDLGQYFDAANDRFIDSLQTINGCDSLVFTNLEYINPEVILPPYIEICEGQSFQASLEGLETGFTIQWSTGATSAVENLDEEGEYWVTITSENCSASDSIEIEVHEIPFVPEYEFDLCLGSSLVLQLPENNGTVIWEDSLENHQFVVQEAGSYSATLQNACGLFAYPYEISPVDCSCKIWIPNAFTPDDDGLNERFSVVHDCDFETYELLIFNRWGEVIFESTDPDESWKGNDEEGNHYVPAGVYTYLFTYSSRDVDNRINADKIYGSVTVVR